MSSEEDIESELESWRPRDILRRTNWLYRVDALRNYDIREMSVLWKLTELYRDYATQFLIWAYAIRSILLSTVDESTKERLEKTFKMIIQMTEIFWSEGYCYLLDFVSIAYYPVTNRFTNAHNGPRFPEESRQTIDTLGNSEAKSLTGLSVNQLKRMFRQFRIPQYVRYRERYRFLGEEAFLHYMVFNRLGDNKLNMSLNYFGGDPRRFTYSIRIIADHLYNTFYHKISGDSMRMWLDSIEDFRYAIWSRVMNGVVVNEYPNNDTGVGNTDTYVHVGIPFESFRIFGFLDDTGFRTTAPGIWARRRIGFFDDIQRAFYSGYMSGHGMKVQVLSLPNGMFGSIYIGPMRVSDSGLLNMSNLDTYLTKLFREKRMNMEGASNQLPAVYGDGIFPQLSTIVARFSSPLYVQNMINLRMSSVRQSIEHLFAYHKNTFNLFTNPDRFRLLLSGDECSKIMFNSFFLLNCFTCLNETPNSFNIRPPSLEEYIPLNETIKPPPNVDDALLGDVYNYYI